MGFYRPISVYIPLCYFRHDYIEYGLTLVVLLRNSMGVDMWADLSKSFWMIDRWAGLTHIPQIYCFSPVFGVLSLFRVYSLNF